MALPGKKIFPKPHSHQFVLSGICASWVALPVTPITEPIWSFHFTAVSTLLRPNQSTLPEEEGGVQMGTDTSSQISSWVSCCLCVLWVFNALRDQPWSISGVDRVTFELVPSLFLIQVPLRLEEKIQPPLRFCWVVAAPAGRAGLGWACTHQGPLQIQLWLCVLHCVIWN